MQNHRKAGGAEERARHDPLKRSRNLLLAALRWTGEHPVVIVAALAIAAGVWAVVGSHRVFRYLSDDHDEGIYLLQANALAGGHVFPPAPRHADAFIPWLSVLRDGKFVLKYAPVHASILAVGVSVLGSARWSLGLIAAGVVVMTYALAKEVLSDRRLAVLASAFLALSPLFLIQSATFLPYCSSLLLLEGFAFALLRGLRTNRGHLLAISGFVFGVSLFARPFDAVIFGAPLGLYFLIRHRHQRVQLARHAGWFALGVVLPLAVTLLYYRAATGSPFRPPFNLLEPNDTVGFGPRRLIPGQPALPFTPTLGWYGVSRHVLLTSFWGFGGLLLIGFFLVGLLQRRRGDAERWVALVAATFACGYAFFWGTYGTGLRGSLTSFIGPFYFLPVLACVALLAAKGFDELWRRDWLMAVMAVAGMVLVSGYLMAEALKVNLRLTAEDRRLYTPVESANLERALVFVPPMWGPHLLHPFAWLQNDAEYAAETVYALDRGEPRNLELLDDYQGRAAYRLRVHGAYRANPPDRALTTSLEPVTVVKRPALDMSIAFENPTSDPSVTVTVTVNGKQEAFVLDMDSGLGKGYVRDIRIGAGAVEIGGPYEARATEDVETDGSITVSISTGPTDAPTSRPVYRRTFGYAVDGAELRILLPGVVPVNELGSDPLAIRDAS
ncbi:MAG: glycosyltransferase family 39 protein [Actinomycetota bacterium]|nr:glycosyltransferase family 39 protein [Actinomycetota bacterium]